MCLFGTVYMTCPDCGHNWSMTKFVYMTTPYAQRGVNKLFVCSKCGSQGKKTKKIKKQK